MDEERFQLASLLLRGFELTTNPPWENGLIGWVDQCALDLAAGNRASISYYRHELGLRDS